MKELVFLIIFVILSTMFALAMLISGFICGAKSPEKERCSTYECGVPVFSDAKIAFDIKFLNYAILFLIFDVETVFLFPFAVAFGQFGVFALCEVVLFILILLFALGFAIKTDMLRWS